MKTIIMEEGGESSGSKSKKAKQDSGKEEPKAGGSGGGAGPGWGFAPPFPFAQQNMGNFATGYPGMMMGRWPVPANQEYVSGGYGGGGQYRMAGQQGYPQQRGGYGHGGAGGSGYGHSGVGGGNHGGAGTSGGYAAGSSRGSGNRTGTNKRRYPCDNCGFMEQLAAKHARARGQQGGAAGRQQGPQLALPPPLPGDKISNLILFLKY